MSAYSTERSITLKHLTVSGAKMIGIKFYPDKVIHGLIKQLPEKKWSAHYGMVVLPNTSKNLSAIFELFKGVAWVNTSHFFINRPVNAGSEVLSVDSYRKRPRRDDWRYCPEEFYQKLELRRYSLNTARIYISHFERFINYYPEAQNLLELSEPHIKDYLSHLVKKGLSDSYINQSINSIKFYFEVVKEMPNRFYSVERPIKKETVPKVLSRESVLRMLSLCRNIKHRCIIGLLYSAGLRRNELLNLTIRMWIVSG